MTNNISVVIPALNEPYLPILQEKLIQVFLNSPDINEWEFIVRTDEGCGNAILAGIHEARNNIVLVIDADGSHNPIYIPFMISKLIDENNDIVYGMKSVSEDSFYRDMVTKIFDFMARIFIDDLPDLMSGYFMFNKSMITEIPHFINHPKVLMHFIKHNKHLSIGWVRITFEKRKGGKSKLGKPKVGMRILKSMILG